MSDDISLRLKNIEAASQELARNIASLRAHFELSAGAAQRAARKYELTDERRNLAGHTLRRIRAVRDIPEQGVRAGDRGGFVESERNLSHTGTAWVSGEARVFGEAQVAGAARVSDRARVSGKARVSGAAWVEGEALVSGEAWVADEAQVSGRAWVFGKAWVFGRAWVFGEAEVSGEARVAGKALVAGKERVSGDARRGLPSPTRSPNAPGL